MTTREKLNNMNDIPVQAKDVSVCISKLSPKIQHNAKINKFHEKVVSDGVKHYERKRLRKTAIFYDVIRKGHVEQVRTIVHAFAEKDEKILRWMLSVPEEKHEKCDNQRTAAVATFRHSCVLILLSLITLITSPIFYAFHGLIRMCTKLWTKQDLLTVMDLPYFYALLSERAAMLELFNEYGASVRSTDCLGNNIFHYLADLAIHDTNKAVCLFHLLVKSCNPDTDIRSILTEAPNRYGVTAQEYLAERGAVTLLRTILQSESLICNVLNEDIVESMDDKSPIHEDTLRSINRQLNVEENNLIEFKLSEFEGKDYGFFRSFVECQHAGEKAEHEIISKLKWPLLCAWSKCKISMHMPIVILSHVYELAFTGLLLYYMWNTGGDHNAIPLAKTLVEALIKQREMKLVPIKDFVFTTNTEVVVKSAELLSIELNSTKYCPTDEYEHVEGFTVIKCLKTALYELNTRNYCNKALSIRNILQFTGIDHEHNTMLHFIAYYARPIHLLFLCSSLFHILWDCIHKMTFLWSYFPRKYGPHTNGLLAYAHIKFPGSYIGNQLLYLSYFAMLRLYIVFQRRYYKLLLAETLSVKENLDLFEDLSYLMVTCLIARGLYHIHSLRMLPSIGQFVIAMFKMGETLLDFSVLYVSVMSIFSIIFHFMLRQDSCPAFKKEGFETLGDSLFYTFKLLNKHATFPFPHPSRLIIVTYVCFTTICCLLLLNLMIASMKTICSCILREPWISFLRDMEIMNEIIGTEFRLQFFKRIMPVALKRKMYECFGCETTVDEKCKLTVYLRAYQNIG